MSVLPSDPLTVGGTSGKTESRRQGRDVSPLRTSLATGDPQDLPLGVGDSVSPCLGGHLGQEKRVPSYFGSHTLESEPQGRGHQCVVDNDTPTLRPSFSGRRGKGGVRG